MKKKILNDHGFEWTSPQVRFADLPLSTYESETRSPWLWLARSDDELYLVNSTGKTIDSISFEKSDGEIIYRDIKPCEAVKVDEYNIYDSDYLIQYSFIIKSKKLGHIEVRSSVEKGGVGSQEVLLWDTREAGEHCYLEIFKRPS